MYYNNNKIQTISPNGSLLKLVSSGLMAAGKQSKGGSETIGLDMSC